MESFKVGEAVEVLLAGGNTESAVVVGVGILGDSVAGDSQGAQMVYLVEVEAVDNIIALPSHRLRQK